MVITHPDAARALADADTRRYLEPFLARERSVRDAALALDVTLDAMLARVRRFVRVGLLIVTRVEPRAGRPVKHYRAAADAFFLPYGSTSFESFEAWFVEEFARREERLARAVSSEARAWGAKRGEHSVGKRVYRDADGRLRADFAFGPDRELDLLVEDAPAIVYTFSFPTLDHAAAKALQAELLALSDRYGAGRGAQRYSLRLALAPVSEEP